MKKTFLRTVSAILCVAMTAAVLLTATVTAGIAGDINGDGEVNNKDVVVLFRYTSGADVEVDEVACDTNGDGEINNKDVVTLFRYVSDPDNIKIFYGTESEAEETAEPDETTEPDETEPDVTEPDETEPDETEPDVTEPDETEPEETEPEVTGPDETEPEITEPDETEPDETEPEITEPDETEPDETEPDETEPEDTEPDETEPEVTEPEETEPEVTEPEETEPEVTEPEETEPEVTEPEETEPEETEPEVTEPEVTEPEETEPEETEPEETEPAAGYDNVFTVWDDSVAGTFSDIKMTDMSLTREGIKLKCTGTSSTGPRMIFNVSEYASIKNKRSITGADASYIVVKIKSTTDGDFRIFGKTNSAGSKTASYKPDNQFHYIIVDMTATKVINDSYISTLRLDWGCGKTKVGDEATITEIGFFSTLDKAIDHCAVIAGTQSGIVRDGTPKKYVTMSFDDGTQQDLRILEILKKYNITKATFFINTGICGADWTEGVSTMVGKPVSHVRFTMDELRTGIYDGYDVEVHTLTHPSLKSYDNNVAQLKKETVGDAINIFNLTGIYPVGIAWPGGDSDQTETTRKLVYEETNLRFGRGIAFKGNHYELPTEFLLWEPTCSMASSTCHSYYFKRFLKKACTEDMVFYGFAHGFEFDSNDSWADFEEFIKMVSEAEKAGDIVLVTNAEFYQLFKDQIPAFVPTT